MNRKSMFRRFAAVIAVGSAAFGFAGFPSAGAAAEATATGSTNNPYSPAYGHPYRHGVIPSRSQQAEMDAWAAAHGPGHSGPSSNTLSYGGGISNAGVTSGQPQVYLVFWGSGWGTQGTDANGNLTFSNDPKGGAPYIQNLFKGLGTDKELWSGTMTQYCDGSLVSYGATSCPSGASFVGYPSSGVLAGVWYDPSLTSTSPTATQIAQEAVNAAAHFNESSYRDAQFDILSPSGSSPDNWLSPLQWCAWHDSTGDGYTVSTRYGNLAFTNMPYVMDVGASCGMNFVNSGSAGTLDGYSIVNGHEYAETITDQYPGYGWTNFQSGAENGDECAWISSGQGAAADVTMATGTFAMQSTWSNDTNECDLSHPVVTGISGGGGSSSTMTVSVAAGSVSQRGHSYQVPLTVNAVDATTSAALSGAGVALDVYAGACSTGTLVSSGSGTTNTSGDASFTFSTKSRGTSYCALATVTASGYTSNTGFVIFTA